jgi:hypothetical protein
MKTTPSETLIDGGVSAERVRHHEHQHRVELKPHYDFIVCGSGSSGSALGKSLPQQRRLDRSPLGVHPPRPIRRRAQDDARRNTATSRARCTLISLIPSAFVSAQRNWITTWSSCRFPFAVRKPRFCTRRPSSTTRVRLTISRPVTHSANCQQCPPNANRIISQQAR